ncbi:MAG: alpha/beta fold hydrolase [Acidiferrobacterales bacterium]|nr:alpha/beta fold hydrolase [Acidiferrobacterales bacterium]
MSENDSIFGSLIYQAIGEPEYWHKNSVEALVKLLTDGYRLDDPDKIAQIRMGKELVGKLSEKEVVTSAVMTVLDDASYGLLLIDKNYQVIYHNRTLKKYLRTLFDPKSLKKISQQLKDQVKEKEALLLGDGNSNLIRLELPSAKPVNVYLRSLLNATTSKTSPSYIHQIMAVNTEDAGNQIYEQISKVYALSEREIGIVKSAVRCLASGGSTSEIAEDLFISPNTVKTHLKSIYSKSGVHSLASLVSLYLQHEIQQLASYFGGANYTRKTKQQIKDQSLILSCGQLICFREYGDPLGKPLIILHNSYSSRLNVPPQGDAIAKRVGRRVIIPDRPGYGISPANEQYPINWSQQLAEFSQTLNLDTFDLLGSSLSARYALEFSDKYPDKLSKLILVAPLLHNTDADKQNFCDWLSITTELFERSPGFATEIYKLWCASASLRLENHMEKNLSTSISSAEVGVIDTSDFIEVMNDNFRESLAQQCSGTVSDFRYCFNKMNLNLAKIKTQTEVWLGSEDSLCSPEGVRQSLAGLVNKTVFVREGYGEHIYYGKFEEILTLRT